MSCPSVYFDNKIVKSFDPSVMSKTWTYHPSFSSHNIETAYIISGGKNLDEVCPDHLKEKWNKTKNLHKAFEKSFKETKVNLKEHCFYDLVPEYFIHEYFGIKNEITKHVFETFSKPKNYSFLNELNILVDEISRRNININIRSLDKSLYDIRARNLKKKLVSLPEPKIKYNVFGTITGRLTTKNKSFPILTLDKRFRGVLKATNNWFVEVDFNAAELRTFLGLNGVSQPITDLHEWSKILYNNKFNENISRDEMKLKFFAWLYSKTNEPFGIEDIDKAFDKVSILQKHWNGENVETIFGRKIQTEENKAVNTAIQSTSADVFFEQVLKVDKYLKENRMNTYISMMIHDSMILDISRKETRHLPEIIRIFSDTRFGKYLTSVKIGSNLGEMKALKIS